MTQEVSARTEKNLLAWSAKGENSAGKAT